MTQIKTNCCSLETSCSDQLQTSYSDQTDTRILYNKTVIHILSSNLLDKKIFDSHLSIELLKVSSKCTQYSCRCSLSTQENRLRLYEEIAPNFAHFNDKSKNKNYTRTYELGRNVVVQLFD